MLHRTVILALLAVTTCLTLLYVSTFPTDSQSANRQDEGAAGSDAPKSTDVPSRADERLEDRPGRYGTQRHLA